MKYGNWIPLSKALVEFLPKDRPYTKLEAAFSLQYDYDMHRTVTLRGYAILWGWSRSKVRKFLNDMGVSVAETGESTRGSIQIASSDSKRMRAIETKYPEAEAKGESIKIDKPSSAALSKTHETPYHRFTKLRSQLNEGDLDLLRSMSYRDFLATEYWKIVREYKMYKQGYKCQLCSAKGNLNVHHRNYEFRGREYAHMEDLIVLCESCHSKYHDDNKNKVQ